jgi:hypothetical protein
MNFLDNIEELAKDALKHGPRHSFREVCSPAAVLAMVAVCRAAEKLQECEDVKARADAISPVEPGCEKDVLNDVYRRCKPAAWVALRSAIAALDAMKEQNT